MVLQNLQSGNKAAGWQGQTDCQRKAGPEGEDHRAGEKWEMFKIEIKEETTKSVMEAVTQNLDLHLAEHFQEMEEREKIRKT